MTEIMVTGCSGFIGMHLCKSLLLQDKQVIGLDSMNDYYSLDLKKARLKKLQKFDNFKFFKVDLCNLESLESIFNNHLPQFVVNLAAQAGVRYSIDNPNLYIKSNIMGFMNIMECCRKYRVERLIYASSSSVYGANNKIPFNVNDKVDKPISIYATSKITNELMAHTYSHLFRIKTVGLRFFTVYGPWGRPDMAYYIFCDKIIKGKPIEIYNNGKLERDFTYIDDIIDGINAVFNNNYECEIFNLGNNKPENIMEIIKLIEDNTGKNAIIKYRDMQPGDVKQTYANIDYSKEKLGYEPKISINEGIPRFIDWFKSYNSSI
tara:strand:- start:3487 stop:4446 length:960 start_codon:yes stop_codon:yes gene_type:complete